MQNPLNCRFRPSFLAFFFGLTVAATQAGPNPPLAIEQAAPDQFPTVEVINVFEPAGESNVRSSFRLGEGRGLVGTEETGDIFKTEDGGLNWRKVWDGGDAWGIQDVRNYLRAQDGHLYITTSEPRPALIARSKDEGEAWHIVAREPHRGACRIGQRHDVGWTATIGE